MKRLKRVEYNINKSEYYFRINRLTFFFSSQFNKNRFESGFIDYVNDETNKLKAKYKELEDDLQIKPCNSGNLTKWAQEGVLMLNSTLTVVKDTPNSHSVAEPESVYLDVIERDSEYAKNHFSQTQRLF